MVQGEMLNPAGRKTPQPTAHIGGTSIPKALGRCVSFSIQTTDYNSSSLLLSGKYLLS